MNRKPAARAKGAEAKLAAERRMKRMRGQIEKLLVEPEFKQMSEALRQSVQQRLGTQELGAGTGVIQARIQSRAARARPYYNIYRYRFW